MFIIGRADDYIALKAQYPTLYKGYEWSLKEFGFLFCYDNIRRGASSAVMEFGCGYNVSMSDALKGSAISLTLLDDPMSGKGIAGDSARVDKASYDAALNGHLYHKGQLGSTDLPSESYDVIFSISVVEHIDDAGMELCTKDAFRLLRPGGRLINSIDIYPRSTRHKVWHNSCLNNGFAVEGPVDLTWYWDGNLTTFLERADIRYKIYNSLSTADPMKSKVKYASHFATALHVARKPE